MRRQHLKFCHFQPVNWACKNPITPKIYNRFSKSSPQFEDVEGGHLGGKFQVRRYFTFAMAWWKLCASTTFEILPLLTCTLCQQNSYISKGIRPIFEIFASARRCWGWKFGWKVSSAQVFYYCNRKVNTLPIDNIWNFATFNLYTVPAKILYLQRYSTDFRNLCLSSEMLRVSIGVEMLRCAGILLLQWQGENLRIGTIWNFATFNLYTVRAKMPYLQWYWTDFGNLSLSPKMLRVGIWVEIFRCAGILLLQWQGKTLPSRTSEILPLNLFTVPAKILYLQRYSTDFRNLWLSSKMFRLAFGWKVSGAQVFCFSNGKVKTLRIDNIWNFATSNL